MNPKRVHFRGNQKEEQCDGDLGFCHSFRTRRRGVRIYRFRNCLCLAGWLTKHTTCTSPARQRAHDHEFAHENQKGHGRHETDFMVIPFVDLSQKGLCHDPINSIAQLSQHQRATVGCVWV
eukprot:scaffold26_cov158-Amphora_coffeaeformis.AAC.7